MAAAVLIADGDADRGRKIAAACRTLGIDVRVARHGAAALEISIARLIETLLLEHGPRPAANGAGPGAPGVEGKLSQVALPELLELFHVNRKTGVIALREGGG